MKKLALLTSLLIAALSLCTSCAFHTYHFGVQDRAAMVPDDFGATEAALASARQSEGAKYCPEKLAKAEELATKGAEVYWSCHNTESADLMAQARQLAKEAEQCGPAAYTPPPPAPKAPELPSCNIAASPGDIVKGQTTTLSWSSKNASKCVIEPGIGPVAVRGSMTVTPQADTEYTLTCSNDDGKTADSAANVAVKTLTQEELCMTLNIEFDTDKAIIKPAYYNEVEKVADFMKKYPGVKGVIEGHTDNVGSAAYNLKLSQRRAESVYNMLIKKYGIDKSRLSAKGYGLTKPIASNKTKEGRQKNRRTMANFGCVTIEK